MSGLYLGLNSSEPGSTLFAFTDSDAEDKYLVNDVIDLCQKKQSSVNFIITKSYCMTDPDAELQVYYKVAKACSGKVLYLNSSELSQVFQWVDQFIQGEMTLFNSFDLPRNPFVTSKEFTIDDQVEYVLITVSGSSSDINVTHNNQRVQFTRVLWLDNTKAVQLNNPQPGKYKVLVSDHADIRIEIEGRTDFTFEHGFSQQKPKTINETTAQPIGDTNNYLSILVSDPSNRVSIKYVEIWNMNDIVIGEFKLSKEGDHFYTTSEFMSPSQKFKIVVNGVVIKSGRNISRFAKIPVQPQPKPIVIPNKIPEVVISEGNELKIKYGTSVKLTCKVSAYPRPSISWRDSSGKVLSTEFSTLLIPYDYVSYITLNNVQKSEEISCYGENYLQSARKFINVKVIYFEINSQLPAVLKVKYGTSKTITCDIRSALHMNIRWYFQKDKSSVKSLLTSSKNYLVSAGGRELTLQHTDIDQDGNYICEATLDGNENEKETLHTKIEVVGLEEPEIAKKNPLLNIFIHSPVTINCKVTKGVPKPTVTWQWKPKDSGWTQLSYVGEELRLSTVTLKSSGTYKCEAKNALGATHLETTLVVHSRPVISANKTKYEVSVGVPQVKIPFSVIGYPKPTVSCVSSGGNYHVFDHGLSVVNPEENESLNFKCEAKNEHGSNSKEFTLAVYQAPIIDKQEQNVPVEAHVKTSPTIYCKLLHGTPKPKVTWQWRPNKSAQWKTLQTLGEKLQLDSVTLSEAGEYKCMANNKEGSDTMTKTLIILSPPIIITNQTQYIGVVSDPQLRIPCKVIGYPQPKISWQKNKDTIIPDKNYSFDKGGLVIIKPQVMETTYTCVAVNEHGKDSKTFNILVENHLTEYGEIKNIFKKSSDVPDEESKKFVCPLSYTNPESIRWFFDGMKTNVTGPIYINDVYRDANFTCRITDEVSTRSHTFVLDIGFAPEFNLNLNTVEWYGLDEIVNCEVTAKPKAEIEWYYNNKKINDHNKFVSVRQIAGWGNYMCRATNVHGTIEKNTTVISRGCLIKRLASEKNSPLALKKYFREDKINLSWPEYNSNSDYYFIESKETVTFSCAGDDDSPNSFKKFQNFSEIDVICDHEDNFIVNDVTYKMSDFNCVNEVKPVVINTGTICHIESINKYKVGFKASAFVEVYEACYDSKRSMIHSIYPINASWYGTERISAEWYQYPGIGGRHELKLYDCKTDSTSCCFAKSQIINTEVIPYSRSAQLSTYIENFNAISEWRACNSRKNSWNYVKEKTKIAEYENFDIVSGASYTNGGVIPKYLWQLLIAEKESQVALVYVNDPAPVDSDILCSKPCDGNNYYNSLELTITDKYTFCCTAEEFSKHFIPKLPNGYID